MLAFGHSACRTLCAALLTISMVVGADAAEPREESGFGSNPGNLRMFSYLPANLPPGARLIVVLHGCKQTAATFARDAGWLALADRSRVALLLPEQKGLPSFLHDVFLFPWVVALWGANNQNACFNWFEPDDIARDRGEALSIRQMIDAMVATLGRRIARVHRRPFRGRCDDGGDARGLSRALRRRRHRCRRAVCLRR
jgi:poly(3-hydroxybutyrate) depolymerase